MTRNVIYKIQCERNVTRDNKSELSEPRQSQERCWSLFWDCVNAMLLRAAEYGITMQANLTCMMGRLEQSEKSTTVL